MFTFAISYSDEFLLRYSATLVEHRRLKLNLSYLHLVDPVGISPIFLAAVNENPWAIVWRCLRDPAFSHFGIGLSVNHSINQSVPACDGQTDRQLDRRTDRHTTTAYTALA